MIDACINKMVTSNKLPERKIMKMSGHNSVAVVPQRTLLGEVNEHIMCPLCRGYYIDATTIVECLHSFCRSCIIKHLQAKSYCPVCEMMINSAKPNIKLDKALQDIVYKLVPGLFQREMERRQQFYASRPGPAASATPEQRGEDTERIIFSPEDVISFSLEYADATDTDSISSKSSDSNEPQPTSAVTRRFLQCPAVVNISHLKKFLSMKFDIDSTQFAIDILYKRVPLPDYYTLMDIAYIYNWKRNEPMRFFYQIIDYIAIRNRLFDINRKGSHFRDRKSSPTSTEDTNVSSPAQNLNDHGSDGSSGADSPMPSEKSLKQSSDMTKKCDDMTKKCDNKTPISNREGSTHDTQFNKSTNASKKNDDEVEKSQFLNSFELTAKNNNTPSKVSPTKLPNTDNKSHSSKPLLVTKTDETLKRKNQTQSQNAPEVKKLKVELENSKVPLPITTSASLQQNFKACDNTTKAKNESILKTSQSPPVNSSMSFPVLPEKETKPQPVVNVRQQSSDSPSKRVVPGTQNVPSPKRKTGNETTLTTQTLPTQPKKIVSPLKLQIPKIESQSTNSKPTDVQKGLSKRIPDLKPSTLSTTTSQNKGQTINKVRMDLLANNSDPTIDRSKILSQVKTSLSSQSNGQNSGDSLKVIFDSCNINIPSSLSITLTDQKLDPRAQSEVVPVDQKKNIVNKNLSNNPSLKIPNPPVHNYIEILKLPDTDPKKPNKPEIMTDSKTNPSSKSDNTIPKSVNKSSETSAKGPVPNLKPIFDTKQGKLSFQQAFEHQVQSMQTDKKPKLPKAKTQMPKLVPAPKVFNVVSKSVSQGNKPTSSNVSGTEPKSSSALDLSTPHNIPPQAGGQQTFDKALETMQSIANLAKKQNLPSKSVPLPMSQSNTFSGITNRPVNSAGSPLRLPSPNNINQMKVDKPAVSHSNISRQDASKNTSLKQANNLGAPVLSPSYQMSAHNSSSTPQPSPRSQTRSPSSSPKLVIAEDKQANSSLEQHSNHSNATNSPLSSMIKNESPKSSSGPSKPGLKPMKTLPSSAVKVAGIRPPMAPNSTISNPVDYLSRQQLVNTTTPHHLLRQMDINAWLKFQRQFDLIKSMSNMAHETQNDFNNKDKQ